MSDLIDRQAALDAIEFGITYAKAINKETGEVKELFQEGNDELRKAAERIKQLPSAQPTIEPGIDRKKLVETIRHYTQYPDGIFRLLRIYEEVEHEQVSD